MRFARFTEQGGRTLIVNLDRVICFKQMQDGGPIYVSLTHGDGVLNIPVVETVEQIEAFLVAQSR